MPTQHTVYAPTQADLAYLLTDAGVLQSGQPVDGMGWHYKGPWSLGGAALASVCALVWWTSEPADEAETAARQATLAALRAKGALYEGVEPAIYLMGQEGPQRPSGHEYIGILRDARRMKSGVKVGDHWFHSDGPSRDLYAQAAALVALGANPQPVPWKTMAGAFVSMTQTLLTQILGSLAISDNTHHVVAEQARAALAAGTLADVHTIAWPKGFGE